MQGKTGARYTANRSFCLAPFFAIRRGHRGVSTTLSQWRTITCVLSPRLDGDLCSIRSRRIGVSAPQFPHTRTPNVCEFALSPPLLHVTIPTLTKSKHNLLGFFANAFREQSRRDVACPRAALPHFSRRGHRRRHALGNFVLIRSKTRVGEGCVIGSYVDIEGEVAIGRWVSLQSGCYITRGVVIEDEVFCGPRLITMNDKRMSYRRGNLSYVRSAPRILRSQGGRRQRAAARRHRGRERPGRRRERRHARRAGCSHRRRQSGASRRASA